MDELDTDRQTIVDVPRLCHEGHASGLTCEALFEACQLSMHNDGEPTHCAMVSGMQVVWSFSHDHLEVINDETLAPNQRKWLLWSPGQFAKMGMVA